jgi:hypothetical protein
MGYLAWFQHQKELKAEEALDELEQETGEPCEECGAVIPFSAEAESKINRFHATSCSLHPGNSTNMKG